MVVEASSFSDSSSDDPDPSDEELDEQGNPIVVDSTINEDVAADTVENSEVSDESDEQE